MKHFNIKDYIYDFKTLPLSLVYSFDDPDEQLDALNKLILERLEWHAPLAKAKFTHSPTPWIKQLDIADLQKNGATIDFKIKNQRNKKSLLQKSVIFRKL